MSISCDPQPPEGAGDFFSDNHLGYLRLDGSTFMTGPIRAADGCQENPGISFNNDVRSGFWRTSAAVFLSVHALIGLHAFYTDGYGWYVGGVSGKVTHANTVAREWTFPDKDGTVALLSDIGVKETLVGTINGVNEDFTATQVISLGTESVFINGVLQDSPAHYTISSATVSFDEPPLVGDSLKIHYRGV